MKHLLRFLTLLVMLTLPIIAANAAASVYVSASGSDSAAGTSSAPLKTLRGAFTKLGEGGGTVCIKGDLNIPANTELAPAGAVTLRGADSSARLLLNGKVFLAGDMTFTDLILHSTAVSQIFGQGHNVTFGAGLTCTVASSGVAYPQIFGGTWCGRSSAQPIFADYTLRVESGTWYHLHGGSLRDGETQPVGVLKNVTVEIAGGRFTTTTDNNATANAIIALTGMDALEGDCRLSISGGEFSCGIFALARHGNNSTSATNAYYEADVTVSVTGGSFTKGHIGLAQDTVTSQLDGNFTVTVSGGSFGSGFTGFDATGTNGIAIADIAPTYRSGKTVTGFDDNLYVSASGNNASNGFSASSPKRSVDTKGGVIHLVGQVPASSVVIKNAKKPVTVTGGTLVLSGNFTQGSDLVLKDVTLAGSGTLSTGGHSLTVENSVTTASGAEIAVNGSTGGTHVITLRGGTYTTVRGGSVAAIPGAVAYVVIDGAAVTGNVVGAESARSAVLLKSGAVGGNIYSFASGGSLGAIHLYGGTLSGKVVDSGSGSVENFAVYADPAFGAQPTIVSTKTAALVPTENAAFVTTQNEMAVALKAGKTAVLTDKLSIASLTFAPSGQGAKLTSTFMGVDYRVLTEAKLSLSGTLRFAESTVIDGIEIEAYTNSAVLSAEGKPLHIGKDTTTSIAPNRRIEHYPALVGGGYQKSVTASPSLVIDGGRWGTVAGGGYHASATTSKVTGNVSVTVNGGEICDALYLSGRGTLTGNAALTVNGGVLDCSVFGAADASTVGGDIQMHLLGGEFHGDIGRSRDGETVGKSFTLHIDGADLDRVGKILMGGGKLDVCDRIDLDAPITGEATFRNPIAGYADPSVVYADGWYYYTYAKSVAGGQGIYMAKAPNLYDIGNVEPQLIWSQTYSGQAPEMTALWAPQLYHLKGEDGVMRWYIYGAAQTVTDPNADANFRLPYVWVGDETDPAGEYTYFGCMENIDTEAYNYLSQRFIYHNNKLYMFCSGFFRASDISPHTQRTRICEMASPTRMKSEQIVISSPSCDYEYSGTADAGIQEGPFPFYAPNGKLYVIFAAGHTRTDYYCTGLLTFTGGETDDLLDPRLWVKDSEPFQFANMEGGVYSPGAMIVTTSPDGQHYYGVYHAKTYHLSAYTMRRMYMQEITFDKNGKPQIEDPLPIDTDLTAPLNSLPLSARIFDAGEHGDGGCYTVTEPAVGASCTEDGKTAVETCSVCGHTRGGEVIPKTGHTLVETPAKAATCTEDGTLGYCTCTTCQKVYTDLTAAVETTVEERFLPHPGHDYHPTSPKIEPTDTEEGRTAVYTCSRCPDSYGGEIIPKLIGSGDVDLDGSVTVRDVLDALRILLNRLAYNGRADMDTDGRITLADVLRILRRTAE